MIFSRLSTHILTILTKRLLILKIWELEIVIFFES